MEEIFENTRSLWLLPLAGLVSAFITCVQIRFLPENVPGGYIYMLGPGALFGGAVAAYYFFFERFERRRKILGFVAACVGAEVIAVAAAVVSDRYFPDRSSKLFEFSLPTYFLSGFGGAVVVLACARFLFGQKSFGWRIWMLIVLGGGAGGMLGVCGSAAGPVLGAGLWTIFHALDLTADANLQNAVLNGNAQVLSLAVTWQTGVAFCIACLMWMERNFMTRGWEPEGQSIARKLAESSASPAGKS
jgi:hypothetical protein